MLAPPDGGDTDTEHLFGAVSGEVELESQNVEIVELRSIDSEGDTTTAPENRKKLSLNASSNFAAVPRIIRARAGAPRPLPEITNLFAGKKIAHLKISDPYALVDKRTSDAQVKFLRALASEATGLDAVTIEYDPSIGDVGERDDPHGVRSKLAVAFMNATLPRVVFNPRRRGRRDHGDFHDREVLVECCGAGGATNTHAIWIGRGLPALMDQSFSLNLAYQPPVIAHEG